MSIEAPARGGREGALLHPGAARGVGTRPAWKGQPPLLDRLVPLRGQRLQPQTPMAWHWHGRAVKSVDGSGGAMPDTEANHQA